MKRTRLIDVAARAGVAPNTASSILNKRPDSWASQETRERVLLAAKELNYQPSKAALALRLGRYQTIGLVVSDLNNPYYPVFADYFNQAAAIHGYDLVIESTRNDSANEERSFRSVFNRQVDGAALIISDTERHRPFLAELAKAGSPVVALSAQPEKPMPVDSVVCDFTAGVTQAIDHLIELGHRRFVFLSALAKGQQDGNRPFLFHDLLGRKGVNPDNQFFVTCEHDVESARDSFRDFLQRQKARRPTALIAMNDLSAIGAIRAAREVGLRVPEDLSVIGADNIPLAEFLPVSLTTISQPTKDMVARAASLLHHRISSTTKSPPSQTIFPTELLIRESTSTAPKDRRPPG